VQASNEIQREGKSPVLFNQEPPRRLSGKQRSKKVLRNSYLPKALDTGRSILLWMLFLFDLGVIYEHKTKQKLLLWTEEMTKDTSSLLSNFSSLSQTFRIFSKSTFCSNDFEQN